MLHEFERWPRNVMDSHIECDIYKNSKMKMQSNQKENIRDFVGNYRKCKKLYLGVLGK